MVRSERKRGVISGLSYLPLPCPFPSYILYFSVFLLSYLLFFYMHLLLPYYYSNCNVTISQHSFYVQITFSTYASPLESVLHIMLPSLKDIFFFFLCCWGLCGELLFSTKGATIRYLGGGLEFLPGRFFISQERLKALIFFTSG